MCLKGSTTEEFSWLTAAEEGFEYQLKALEHLRDESLSFGIALVSIRQNNHELFNRLREMDLERIMIEKEEIKLYPQVKKRLDKEGILHYFEKK